jgi:hypothetical protein
MAVSCDPNTLLQQSACFNSCIPHGSQLAVQTYLLAVIAGGSQDPNALLQAAKAFQSLGEKSLLEVQAYLLCQILNK